MTGDRKKKWGDPKRFLQRRIRKARDDREFTSEETVYAHYKRWTFRSDREPVRFATFIQKLREVHGSDERVVNGHPLAPCVVIDREEEKGAQKSRRKKNASVIRGRVRVTHQLKFVDGLLAVGTELDWMTPSEAERQHLQQDRQAKGQQKNASWLVVVWKGMRRRIPGDSVERIV